MRLWVAIARAPAGARKADSILYLHGGPGIATVDTWFPFFPDSVAWGAFRETRDIVFFDQRGTGRSQPILCPALKADLQSIDRAAPLPAARLVATVDAYAKCRRIMLAAGAEPAEYTSLETVEDAEDLRRALGVREWNVYGTSYGTFVALLYLRAHPGSIRAAILDSPYPPNSTAWAEQITVTAKAYDAVERACHRNAACATRFPDISGRLRKAVARLDAHPLDRPEGPIDGAKFVEALWPMLVRGKSALMVPLAIDLAAAGDDSVVRRLVAIYGGEDSFGDFSAAQAMAINCHEGGLSTSATRAAMRLFPHLGGNDLPESADRVCKAFQPRLAAPSLFAPVASDKPVLAYTGEFDPATPTEDTWNATRFLSRSTVVQVAGASHAPFYQDECTRGIAHAFLSAPDRVPDTQCMEKRPEAIFELSDIKGFLSAMEAKK
jgi:pimeloyl-ACP methyl ester carboxylesterase